MRQPRSWIVLLCVAAAVALFAAPGASAITSAECDARVNDTPSKLIPCIQTADLWNHMVAFQAIADANPSPADGHPSRNSGEPGYRASVDYVARLMADAGYDVTIQPYKFLYYAYTAVPTFNEVSPTAHSYTLNEEWGPGRSTGVSRTLRSNRPAASFFRQRLSPVPRADARRLTSRVSCPAGSR
ncbi:MAG: hypothetical protein ACJ74B_06130 [Gaiellaceae bacterium]